VIYAFKLYLYCVAPAFLLKSKETVEAMEELWRYAESSRRHRFEAIIAGDVLIALHVVAYCLVVYSAVTLSR
jgi:hypothetical protein